jgi:predicted PurR-regulated permease PerM
MTDSPSIMQKTPHPWYHNRFFKYASGVLLVLLIIFVFYQVAFLLAPFFNFASSLFAPLAISLLFYYLLRPIIYKSEEYGVPRILTILVIYFAIALILILFFIYVGPMLASQVTAIANTSVETFQKLETEKHFLPLGFRLDIQNEIEQRLITYAKDATVALSSNVLNIVGYITHLATILAVIPFIVFYLLKNDNDFSANFLDQMPEDYTREVRRILKNVDDTLSSFINGLVIVSCSVGGMLFIGYLIIGLDYALILSTIAIIFMTIPFLGPFLAIGPAIFVGLSMGGYMVWKVIIIFIIVQQIEANILSPQVLGHKLHIHPLTLILVLLAAGSLYGLIGLLLATPTYALLKVLITNLYKIYMLRYPKFRAKLAAVDRASS